MKKTFGKALFSLFSRTKIDEEFFEDLEDTLIEGDIGALLALEITSNIRQVIKKGKTSKEDIMEEMKKYLLSMITNYSPDIKSGKTNVFLILGVNGVGKTTTIAKLAMYYKNKGISTVFSAADTFRAAAIDQLELHAQRTNTRIVRQNPGSDPGAVIFDTIESAISKGEQLILADTAGRMHNKENLLRELQKIDKIVLNKIPSDAYKKFIVIDATTGQNGVRQAEMFNNAVKLDGVILTKYDSAAKGGAILQISKNLNLPIAFVGTGEGYSDLSPFNCEEFVETLIGMN